MLGRTSDKRILGLDWDARSVRLMDARLKRNEIQIVRALSAGIPADADGAVKVGEFLRELLDREKIRTRSVVIDIPRDQAVLNTLTLPAKSVDDLSQMVQFQIVKELSFSVNEAAVDFTTAPVEDDDGEGDDEDGGLVEVLVAAVRNEVLEYYQQVCFAAGLDLQRIGLRPYANLVALTTFTKTPLTGKSLFVDLGPMLTEIDVLRGEHLAFSRAASVVVPEFGENGQILTMHHGQNDQEQGGSTDLVLSTPTSASMVVADVMVEVNRSIEAYRATDPGVTFSRVVIGGETGLESEVAEAIQKRLGSPTALYEPAGSLRIKTKSTDAASFTGFGAVIGLLAGQLRDGVMKFDFLHPKQPGDQRQARIRKVPYIAAIVALFLMAGGVAWWQFIGRETLARNRELDTKISAEKKLDGQLAKADKLLQGAQDWHDHNVVWIDELNRMIKSFPGNKDAYLTQLKMEEKGRVTIKLQAKNKFAGTEIAKNLAADVPEGSKKSYYRAIPQRTTEMPPKTAPQYLWSTSLETFILHVEKAYEDSQKRTRSSSR